METLEIAAAAHPTPIDERKHQTVSARSTMLTISWAISSHDRERSCRESGATKHPNRSLSESQRVSRSAISTGSSGLVMSNSESSDGYCSATPDEALTNAGTPRHSAS